MRIKNTNFPIYVVLRIYNCFTSTVNHMEVDNCMDKNNCGTNDLNFHEKNTKQKPTKNNNKA